MGNFNLICFECWKILNNKVNAVFGGIRVDYQASKIFSSSPLIVMVPVSVQKNVVYLLPKKLFDNATNFMEFYMHDFWPICRMAFFSVGKSLSPEHCARWKEPIVLTSFHASGFLGCSTSDFPLSGFFGFDQAERSRKSSSVCQDIHSKMSAFFLRLNALRRDSRPLYINLDHMELDISILVVVVIFPFPPR